MDFFPEGCVIILPGNEESSMSSLVESSNNLFYMKSFELPFFFLNGNHFLQINTGALEGRFNKIGSYGYESLR